MNLDPYFLRPRRRRHLTAVRLLGATAVALVAQIAVDMPQGYFGGADRVTPIGAAYAGLAAAATALAVLARWRWPRLCQWLAPVVHAVHIGAFLPPMISDPVISGVVVVWNLLMLATQLFPTRVVASGRTDPIEDEDEAWLFTYSRPTLHLAGVGIVMSIAAVGYRLSDSQLALAVGLGLDYAALAYAAPFLWRRLRRRVGSAVVVTAPFLVALAFVARPATMLSLAAVGCGALALLLIGQYRSTGEVMQEFYDHPSRLIIISFAGAIVVGTVLLTFPAAAGAARVSPIDAFFTATSAVCVTGLIVLDTPTAFSGFGHVVLLALIQVGGLGIMVLSTFATLLLGGVLGLRGESALRELLEAHSGRAAYLLVRFIVLSTLVVEAVGAALLTACYAWAGAPLGEAAWKGVFHAVSAFCNAGFALQSDSLVMFQGNELALVIVATLITLGGIGFAVLAGVWSWMTRRGKRPTVQVRAVLAASAVLVVAGWILYLGAEWDRSLAGMTPVDKVVNALFQSVTLRTAGFNTVDLGRLAPATTLVMMIFMFVGASPGSTGGGIKTTTLVVLLATLRTTVQGRRHVRLWDREIPREVVYRALAIAVLAAWVATTGLFLLLVFEDQEYLTLAFEVVSAVGTVGLSLGATPVLGPVGKLIIIVVMFVGRVGPLSLALVLGTGRDVPEKLRYPPVRIMVG